MITWMCRDCFRLEDGEELELHILEHARSVPWSYYEVHTAIHDLRRAYAHCSDCKTSILEDVQPLTLNGMVRKFFRQSRRHQ